MLCVLGVIVALGYKGTRAQEEADLYADKALASKKKGNFRVTRHEGSLSRIIPSASCLQLHTYERYLVRYSNHLHPRRACAQRSCIPE